MLIEQLPHVDEHVVDVRAHPDTVWSAALRTLHDSFHTPSARVLARLLGCDPAVASRWGDGSVGSAIPGFRVVAADRPHLLVVAGRHRFSRYGLVVRIEPHGAGARCRAETRAEFPGLHGRVYRGAVIGTHAHVVAVRRILRAIRRTAECTEQPAAR